MILAKNAVDVEVGTFQTVSPAPLKVKLLLDVIASQVPLIPLKVSVLPLTMLFVKVLFALVLVKVQAPENVRL